MMIACVRPCINFRKRGLFIARVKDGTSAFRAPAVPKVIHFNYEVVILSPLNQL